MKKGGIVFVLFVISVSILLISISFVGAGLFGDVWGKITGKVVDNASEDSIDGEEVPSEEPPAEESECPPPLDSNLCPDEKTPCSMIRDEQECSVWDCSSCPIESIEEVCGDGICQEGEKCDADCCEEFCTLDCPNGAIEGSCGCECIELDKECNNGKEKYYKCSDGTKVPECVCEEETWVCVISPKKNCPEIGPEPKTCATKIQITPNKEVYKIGDEVKMIIEIFDSQGNHIPDYSFYGQMYDDRWHTPDLRETDNKGYFIYKGIAEKPAGGVTEVQFKVYTRKKGSCGSVENIASVKIELEECGFGKCAPEPECEDKTRKCGGECTPCSEDDEDEEIFYSCSGCDLENKCYTYGFRKAGNYCSDANDNFVSQLEDNGICENNFECKTNLCINGNCVSSNVWNKFLGWFRNVFGGGEDEEVKDCSKLLIEKDIGDWEYLQSIYGSTKESQVPVYAEDGTYLDTMKCCMAGYANKEKRNEEKAVLVCPYDDRQDLENSLYWILANEQNLRLENIDLVEYKGQTMYGDAESVAIIWTSDNYLVGSGGSPSVGTPFSVQISDAYLKKYQSDLDLTEDDIPYIPSNLLPDEKGKSFVFCTEEDKELAKECGHSGGAPQSDPSTLERTGQSKIACIESGGHTEGCCEVYTGCIMPDENCEDIAIVSKDECYWHVAWLNNNAELCEKITDGYYKGRCLRDTVAKIKDSKACEKIENIEYRNKCYMNLAEYEGDVNICSKITDGSLKEKCYFWIAGEEGNACPEIADSDLHEICYVEAARKTEDASYCDKITDTPIADKCYRTVAEITNDRSLCEKLIGEQAKQKCFDNTS
ncbi:MAG: hypothetical protein ABIH59_03175 [archaeon]